MVQIRRKSKNIYNVFQKYVLIWSGVAVNELADHGKVFLLHQSKAKSITDHEEYEFN